MYARGAEILTGALKTVSQTYRENCDEVKNVFKTYREVIDKMGKVSLRHINRLPQESTIFQDGWPNKNMKNKELRGYPRQTNWFLTFRDDCMGVDQARDGQSPSSMAAQPTTLPTYFQGHIRIAIAQLRAESPRP